MIFKFHGDLHSRTTEKLIFADNQNLKLKNSLKTNINAKYMVNISNMHLHVLLKFKLTVQICYNLHKAGICKGEYKSPLTNPCIKLQKQNRYCWDRYFADDKKYKISWLLENVNFTGIKFRGMPKNPWNLVPAKISSLKVHKTSLAKIKIRKLLFTKMNGLEV